MTLITLRTPYVTVPIATDRKEKFIYGKRFCKKKVKSGTHASISKMKAAEKYRKSLWEQKASLKQKPCSEKQSLTMRKKKFVAKSENITVGMLLDLWVEEELKPGNLSNGTVMSYQGTVNRIKQHLIGNRKLKTVTADHLQAYIDFLSFGGTNPDGTTAKALSKGYLRLFSAVLQRAFRFAVFPKKTDNL